MDQAIPAFGAVDIGGTKTAVGLVAESGEILAHEEMPTRPESGPDRCFDWIIEFLKSQKAPMRAIGVGCTGPVDAQAGTVGDVALLPGWSAFSIRDALESALGVPVAVENDCDAAALGEFRWGTGVGLERFLYVTISTGIGAGLVLDGRIYRGAGGVHPEPGHMTIDPAGPPCYCGSRGCWESLVSGTALSENHARRYSGQPRMGAREIFERARTGEPAALESVATFGDYLAIGLGNLMTLYAPERVTLGGGVMRSADLFLPAASAAARRRAGLVRPEAVSIVTAAGGAQAGLIGAAATASLYLQAEQGSSCIRA